MIPMVSERIKSGWQSWFQQLPPNDLEYAVVVGGNPKRRRATVFFGSKEDRTARVVVKLAAIGRDGEALENEYSALCAVGTAAPKHLIDRIPRALDLLRSGSWVVLVGSSLAGRPAMLPPGFEARSIMGRRLWLKYVRGVVSWTQQLEESTRLDAPRPVAEMANTVRMFIDQFSPAAGTRGRLETFAKAVEGNLDPWSPAWQHGDTAVGNTLFHRGKVGFVDWERGSASSPPWRDRSYIPPISVMQALRSAPKGDLNAAISLMGDSTWIGSMMRAEIQATWSEAIPLPWAVVITTMQTALDVHAPDDDRHLPWVALAQGLIANDEIRRTARWLSPEY